MTFLFKKNKIKENILKNMKKRSLKQWKKALFLKNYGISVKKA